MTIEINNPLKHWEPCDDNGPVVYLDKDYQPTTDMAKVRSGTVTCSKCGSWAIWRDLKREQEKKK